MSMLGIHLGLSLGASVPEPASPDLLEALVSAEVTHTDEGRSGFQIVLRLGRGSMDVGGYALLADPAVAVGSRVICQITVAGTPAVLFDGFITNQQFKPSVTPGESSLTLTGEDVSSKMDQEERNEEYPGQSDEVIVQTVLSRYAEFGVTAQVASPEASEQPTTDERAPVQQGTDLQFLQELAQRHGFVFYVVPGPSSGSCIAVWGPPVREETPQPALSVNLGPETNVDSIDFEYDGLAAELYVGRIQDREGNEAVEVSSGSTGRTTLAQQGSGAVLQGARTRIYRSSAATSAQAFAEAQALSDASLSNVAKASGELDTGRYGGLLQARALVDLRGVGFLFDGTWYVKSVTHKIAPGSYKQSFELGREGTGALTSSVEV
jgi:phage protein D